MKKEKIKNPEEGQKEKKKGHRIGRTQIGNKRFRLKI